MKKSDSGQLRRRDERTEEACMRVNVVVKIIKIALYIIIFWKKKIWSASKKKKNFFVFNNSCFCLQAVRRCIPKVLI